MKERREASTSPRGGEIQPCSTIESTPRTWSITPNPVTTDPGSIPRMRTTKCSATPGDILRQTFFERRTPNEESRTQKDGAAAGRVSSFWVLRSAFCIQKELNYGENAAFWDAPAIAESRAAVAPHGR